MNSSGDGRGSGTKTPKRNRRTNRQRRIVGKFIRELRLSRSLTDAGVVQLQDTSCDVSQKTLTQRELAPRIEQALKRLAGPAYHFDTGQVHLLEAGVLALTHNLLKAVAEGLNLAPREEAALMELAGFDGSIALIKAMVNVPPMPTADIQTLIEKIAADPTTFSLTMEEIGEVLRLWTQAFFKEMRRMLLEEGHEQPTHEADL
jgi:hypothetical protein